MSKTKKNKKKPALRTSDETAFQIYVKCKGRDSQPKISVVTIVAKSGAFFFTHSKKQGENHSVRISVRAVYVIPPTNSIVNSKLHSIRTCQLNKPRSMSTPIGTVTMVSGTPRSRLSKLLACTRSLLRDSIGLLGVVVGILLSGRKRSRCLIAVKEGSSWLARTSSMGVRAATSMMFQTLWNIFCWSARIQN